MAKAKEIAGLETSTDALEAARRVLQTRFAEISEIRQNSTGLASVDVIHDLRVGMRRLRSALRDFMPLLDKDAFDEIKKELKKIADALGKVRDQDVAIKALEELQSETESESVRTEIYYFVQIRKEFRADAEKELVYFFDAEKTEKLSDDLTDKLAKIKQSKKPLEFEKFGKKVISENLQQLEELSSALYTPFDSENLHRLRLRTKRLRYAMKIFAVCLEDDAKKFAKKISKLQTFLGNVHDCDEWIIYFLDFLRDGEDSLEQNKRETLLWLLTKLTVRRNENYLAALSLWNDWKTEYFFPRLKAMTL